MSQERRHGRGHDFYMDVWHRKDSMRRFVDGVTAGWMSQIDVDSCEYCHMCYEPVALIETKDVKEVSKVWTVTRNLATRADLEAYLVEYELSGTRLKCVSCDRVDGADDIDLVMFHVTRWDATTGLFVRDPMSPQAYAEWLWKLRYPHWTTECRNPAAPKMLVRVVTNGPNQIGEAVA